MPDYYDDYHDIARFYDAENRDLVADLRLYSALYQQVGGPVLDVGCGTGRVALHLAGQGAEVLGMDVSPAMLERARIRLAGRADLRALVSFRQADMVHFTHDRHIGLAVIAYNGFMHLLDQADQVAALARMAAVLRDDGLLVIDLPNAAEIYAARDELGLVHERTFTDETTGMTVMQHSISRLDRAAQMLEVTWVYDSFDPEDEGVVRRRITEMDLRYTFCAEMQLLLGSAGLTLRDCWGDYDRTPYLDGAPRMIVAAGKAI